MIVISSCNDDVLNTFGRKIRYTCLTGLGLQKTVGT